ncbi:Uncharacterised protein [Yersinia enterocolitica]|nr:hypothetical protein D322_3121 [Yersinia enterocolitica IP 10393]CNC54505.1 Uncharacterised protein [Yersinia enterocolitica]CQJ38038.1 Uncharacterised protein [Yersinia enterocolitica]VEB08592.1 Uncharacterised protein [Yersinia enterocolitica subsp. enterocolitica]
MLLSYYFYIYFFYIYFSFENQGYIAVIYGFLILIIRKAKNNEYAKY